MQRLFSRLAAFSALWLTVSASAQTSIPSPAANLRLSLERLANTGSVLMIAAHPDDENTSLLAYSALGRRVRTGYLSLTRGEGGQNVIGPEQGHLLGVIRTEELLAARRIDGAEQFFTSAVDFGYSKTAEETLRKWDRDHVTGDIVRIIREFQPDVVILRWTGTPADGHGQHQAAGILGMDGVLAAADAGRYQDQGLKPWTTPRTFIFRTKDGPIPVEVGGYDPLLGYSYTEIAGMSRSRHESQAMGTAQSIGPSRVYLEPAIPKTFKGDFLDGIALGPERLSPQVAEYLKSALAEFDAERPYKTIPNLLHARRMLRSLSGNLVERKLRELDEVVAKCAGLSVEAVTAQPSAAIGSRTPIQVQATNRSPVSLSLESVNIPGAPMIQSADLPNNIPVRRVVGWSVQEPVPMAEFRFRIGAEPILISRPILYRYVDKILGDRTQPFAVIPAVSVRFVEPTLLFPSNTPREISVMVRSYSGATKGSVRLNLPQGWSSNPENAPFDLPGDGMEATIPFRVSPSDNTYAGDVTAVADIGVKTSSSVRIIRYPHIPTQTVVLPASARFVRENIRVLAHKVGYIMGAGDQVPDALRQLGCTVSLLTPSDLAGGDLEQFDAIIAGVRAFNVRPDLKASITRLNDYVHKGGALIVQYNTADNSLGMLGPFPIKIGSGRVSVEDAPVQILKKKSVVLTFPNAITASDFEGWVQERGLYFPSQWDAHYEAPIASNDPGENALPGGILYTKYGEGAYIYTSYSWFRQLPAGVPGAYRIFANMLSQ
jgi:LmbE family N-acetylglucosaminyl deacetylase